MMKVVRGTLVEFRAGATGFSVEVNGYQVYWNAKQPTPSLEKVTCKESKK